MESENFDDSMPATAWKAMVRRNADHNLRNRSRRPAVSKPMEAFLLGLITHDVRLARSMRAGRNDPAAQLTAHSDLDRLFVTSAAMSSVINHRVRVDLIGVLNTLKSCVGDRTRRDGVYDGLGRLRTLADRALQEDGDEMPWYKLGKTVGKYRRALHSVSPSSDTSTGPPGPPGFSSVVGAVAALPEAERDRVPLLRSLAASSRDTATEVGREEALAVLTRFIGENPDAWPYQIEGVDALTVTSVVDTLVDQILEVLRPKQGGLQNPVWDKNGGVLTMRLKPHDAEPTVIRRVRGQGNVISRILDAFEAKGWTRRISDPLTKAPRRDPQRLHKTVASLNKGLTGIRFHVEEGGMWVRWEPLSVS